MKNISINPNNKSILIHCKSKLYIIDFRKLDIINFSKHITRKMYLKFDAQSRCDHELNELYKIAKIYITNEGLIKIEYSEKVINNDTPKIIKNNDVSKNISSKQKFIKSKPKIIPFIKEEIVDHNKFNEYYNVNQNDDNVKININIINNSEIILKLLDKIILIKYDNNNSDIKQLHKDYYINQKDKLIQQVKIQNSTVPKSIESDKFINELRNKIKITDKYGNILPDSTLFFEYVNDYDKFLTIDILKILEKDKKLILKDRLNFIKILLNRKIINDICDDIPKFSEIEFIDLNKL